MSARLFTEVRERRGLCYSVYASQHTLWHRRGVCYCGTGADRAQETLDCHPRRASAFGKGITGRRVGSVESPDQECPDHAAGIEFRPQFLVGRDWYHLGRARTVDELGQLIDALSSRSINAYLAEHPPAISRW